MTVIPPFTDQSAGITVDASACELDDLAPCGGVDVKVDGDVRWDELVERAAMSGWPGLERLGGRAGTAADAVRVNAEADGQAVADSVASVRAWDRAEERAHTFALAECAFGPGTSRFLETLPGGEDRYEIRDVSFLFETGTKTRPIRDPQLATLLGIEPGERVPLTEYAARRGLRAR